MIWVQSSGRALDVGDDWGGPGFELLELLGIVGNRLGDVRHPDGKLQSESRLAAVFIRSVVCRKNRRRRAIDGATGKAKGFGGRLFGGNCAMHTDLTSSNTLLAVTEDVCLDSISQ